MPVSPRFGRGVSTDDSPGVVSLFVSLSLVRACSLFPRSRSLAGALFVDWVDVAIVEDRICFWIHRSGCFVAQTSASLRGMRFIALFFRLTFCVKSKQW
jgi:hypothetical protein